MFQWQIRVIAQKELSDCNGDSVSVVSSTATGVILFSSGRIVVCEPCPTLSTTMDESNFFSLLHPVASAALGLDSDGSVYCGCAKSAATHDYRDVMLSVFSVATCGKIAPPTTSRQINLSIPSLRHWLLISTPGDGEIDGVYRDHPNHSAGDIDRGKYALKGGASNDILFELTCGENPVAGLIPISITKEVCGSRVAVMFSSGFFGRNSSENYESNRDRNQTKAYTILDIKKWSAEPGLHTFQIAAWSGCCVLTAFTNK